ncbi:HipA family kinase [Virgibacillus byunsanensis]|uniref:HipA family kinase n=1 Tax=Virgibacillus byunsanensis TaxID=570945 RepID=A0ABW3LPH8_9BACI
MIKPVAYLKKLEGKSNAHLIRFNDNREYVVKYFQPGFEKSLCNEWIGYCLGRYIGLPIPYAKIVQIPQEFSSQIPELKEMSTTQHQFASLYVSGCMDAHKVSSVPEIINYQSLASIIVFDYWLCNGDRTRKNILLCAEQESVYRLWAIDHAEILGGYNWVESELENLSLDLMKSATHQLMANFIKDEEDFRKQVEIIQTIPILLMEEIVTLIPDDWMVTKEEKKAIVTTLLKRRDKVLPRMMKLFLNKTYKA